MSTYTNNYKPPELPRLDGTLSIPPEEYDFNFIFPVTALSTSRVELRPFVPSLHAQLLHGNFVKYPETQEWLPMPTATLDDVLESIEARRRLPSFMLYAVYTDKPGTDALPKDPADYKFAGTVGCINASADNLVAELGWIIIFPPYQRSHVLNHAAGALMHYLLDMPAEGGLGLRRCQWFTTSLNIPSQRSALRLGFTFEGLLRNHRIVPPGKIAAREGRPGDAKPGQMSRDDWLASITWQEWEGGVRERLDGLIARR